MARGVPGPPLALLLQPSPSLPMTSATQASLHGARPGDFFLSPPPPVNPPGTLGRPLLALPLPQTEANRDRPPPRGH